jgi:hypothetical protein
LLGNLPLHVGDGRISVTISFGLGGSCCASRLGSPPIGLFLSAPFDVNPFSQRRSTFLDGFEERRQK